MFNRAVKGADLIPITETGDLNVCESTDPYILPFPCAVGLTPQSTQNHANETIYLTYTSICIMRLPSRLKPMTAKNPNTEKHKPSNDKTIQVHLTLKMHR